MTISSFLPDEICSRLGLPQAYRGRQIFKWISRGARDFSEMTDIPKALRDDLAARAKVHSTTVTEILRADDASLKLQVTTEDGLAVEAVLLTDRDGRKTACLSCQAGCAMGCAFCKTGSLGFARDLGAGEIVEQFFFLEREAGEVSNIVFMGMGEPLMNIEQTRRAIEILTHKDGRALSARRITISTCGIVDGILDLAENGPKVRLALSLTTADETLRASLMPIARQNPLPSLRRALETYAAKTGLRATLECALMAGVNTDEKSAARLADFARGLDANINLIAWNPVEGLEFKSPTREECEAFAARLVEAGLNVTMRHRRGRSIQGACGQLGKTKFN